MKHTHLLCLLISLFSCDSTNKPSSDQVVATIGNEEVTLSELDKSIEDQLYEQLISIYHIRRIALEEIVAEKVLEKEARLNGISRDELVDNKVFKKLSSDGLKLYCKENNITDEVFAPGFKYRMVKTSTKEGQEILWNSYKNRQLDEYCLQLMTKYNVQKKLDLPFSPKKNLDGIGYFSLGDKKSDLNINVIFDFNCESCKAAHLPLKKIYEKYKKQAEFRFTILSDSVGSQSIACQCASKVGEFDKMYDFIYETDASDPTVLQSIIKEKNLTPYQECVKDEGTAISLMKNINKVKLLNIVYTPSILVNNRIYHGQIDESSFSNYIDKVRHSIDK